MKQTEQEKIEMLEYENANLKTTITLLSDCNIDTLHRGLKRCCKCGRIHIPRKFNAGLNLGGYDDFGYLFSEWDAAAGKTIDNSLMLCPECASVVINDIDGTFPLAILFNIH